MSKPDFEKNLREEPQPQRTRRIGLRGVGLDPASGVFKFAGEIGGPPDSVVLSGDALEAYESYEERTEAEITNARYDALVDSGYSKARAMVLAGIDSRL